MSKLWYQEPAGDWNHALPLGNGSMGAMCFGGTIQDRWSLNDDTIYSGGFMDRVNPDAREGIEPCAVFCPRGVSRRQKSLRRRP